MKFELLALEKNNCFALEQNENSAWDQYRRHNRHDLAELLEKRKRDVAIMVTNQKLRIAFLQEVAESGILCMK